MKYLVSTITSLWNYRGFISGSVRREFQLKYRNSILGVAWTIVNPLALILVYTVIFSHVMKTKLPHAESGYSYSIYLCSGILTWGLFADICSKAQTVFIENANLIKKINFPRICLPVVVVINSLINFLIIFSLFLVFLAATGTFPGMPFVALFPILLVQVLFSIGLGIALGVLNVFFRDVGHFFGVFLQFWFWMTPVVYPISILPERFHWLFVINPLAAPIMAYQQIFVHSRWPDWAQLAPFCMIALLMCVYGISMFRKHAGEMVDEL